MSLELRCCLQLCFTVFSFIKANLNVYLCVSCPSEQLVWSDMPPCSIVTKRNGWAKPLSSKDVCRIKKRKQFAKRGGGISSSSGTGAAAAAVYKVIARAASTIVKSAAAAIRKAVSSASKKSVAAREKRTAPALSKASKGKYGKAASTRKNSAALTDSKQRPRSSSAVYVLELEGWYVYVGKTSRSVEKRLSEHMGASSS
jgi:hypothetical protein